MSNQFYFDTVLMKGEGDSDKIGRVKVICRGEGGADTTTAKEELDIT